MCFGGCLLDSYESLFSKIWVPSVLVCHLCSLSNVFWAHQNQQVKQLKGINCRRFLWNLVYILKSTFCFFQDRRVDQRIWTKENWLLSKKFILMLILILTSLILIGKLLTIPWLKQDVTPFSQTLASCHPNVLSVAKFLFPTQVRSHLNVWILQFFLTVSIN